MHQQFLSFVCCILAFACWIHATSIVGVHQKHQHQFQLESSSVEDLFLFPAKSSNSQSAAFVMLGGASVPSAKYFDLLLAIKNHHPSPLWIASPQTFANIPLPVDATFDKIDRAIEIMFRQGMPHDIPIFIGGHSLGAATAQAYVKSGRPYSKNVIGSLFLGASLLRKYNGTQYPQPWISLVGTMDGLHRPSRVAQGFYHYVENAREYHGWLHTPVISVKGMNHMQFANDDFPGSVITRKLDLAPEVDGETARQIVAKLLSNFMILHYPSSAGNRTAAENFQREAIKETSRFLRPIIGALEMEASYHLKKPCNSDNPSPHCPYYPVWPEQPSNRQLSNDTDCFCEVPWSNIAVKEMVGLPAKKYRVHSVDAIHDVRDTKPFHHAHIWNNCSMNATPCTLNLTTVSELAYDKFDELDTGFTHATAAEIRVKMKSRQLYHRAANEPDAPYSLDDNTICQSINRKALRWALDNASPYARERYEKYGQPMEFLEDYHFPVAIGPLWINNRLKFKDVELENGNRVLQVQSISMRTTIDGWINRLHPDSGGQHYCKLLSPARAMEWIYTDGLRWKLGVNAHDLK